MSFKTPLAKARGLGSARSGTRHWWVQRVTAVALIPLSFWLILFVKQLFQSSYIEISHWLASPFNSVLLLAWAFVGFYHGALGLQVVIEDYISSEGLKISLIWSIKLIFFTAALSSLVFVMRIVGSVG